MKKIISYNVNGIRAAINKGFIEWLKNENPDIICIQELKAQKEQLNISAFEELGYSLFWNSAEKKGYSGVAVFTKVKPDKVIYGIGIQAYDKEGRLIRVDYGDMTLLSAYFPSGSSGDERQAFKMKWLGDFHQFINNLKKERPNLIISGDYNICHKPVDIHHPEHHEGVSGFLPEEREWFDNFVDSGFTDSFRFFHKEPDNYSWWSYRGQARQKNLGWRIDYHLVSTPVEKFLKGASILPYIEHSDHCPVVVEVDF
jgi:exodeoxyribonuclease-3